MQPAKTLLVPENLKAGDFEQLMFNIPVAAYICDCSGKITFYNKAAEELWGRKPEANEDYWCGSWKLFRSNGTPISYEESPMARCIQNKAQFKNEKIIIQKPDYSFKHLMVYPQLLKDADGTITGAFTTLVDITEQENDETKQATHSAIIESSDDAIISKDLNGTIISWNKGAEKIFKYKEEEVLGKPITILIPDSKKEDENIILSRIKKGKKIAHFETIRVDKNGKEIPISLTVSPIKNNEGNVVGASKVARDISDKLKGEEKQAILSAIVESSDDAIVSKDLNGIIMSWNSGAEKIFGYSEKEVVGKSVTILIPEERLNEETQILQKIRSGKKLDHFETIRRHKTGRQIYISLTVSPIKSKEGKIIGASKIARDITAQVQAKEEISKYTRNLEILNSLGKSISRNMNLEVIVQQVINATTSLTGASIGAFYYSSKNSEEESVPLLCFAGPYNEVFENSRIPKKQFRQKNIEKHIIRSNNIQKEDRLKENNPFSFISEGEFHVESYLEVPVISTTGEVLGGLYFGHSKSGIFKEEHEDLVVNIAVQAAISLDNSKLFEQVKSFSEKKDEFIALTSHELKTPLTTINGYLQLLAKKEKDEVGNMFLQKSLKQVKKLNSLIEDLLHMSRFEAGKLELDMQVFDFRKILADIAETFKYQHNSRKIKIDLGAHPVHIKADEQRIQQAVLNLLSNALKYSPNSSEIEIQLTTENEHAILKIKDEGIGLEEEEQKMIFTRFYRAKSTERISGLGLGLYLTKKIIERHQGEIWVESQPGKGSSFYFSLPMKKEKNIQMTV